jgi:hypothetical protein
METVRRKHREKRKRKHVPECSQEEVAAIVCRATEQDPLRHEVQAVKTLSEKPKQTDKAVKQI